MNLTQEQREQLLEGWRNQLALAERLLEEPGCVGRDADEVKDAIKNAKAKIKQLKGDK
jgi:hypothetical protein